MTMPDDKDKIVLVTGGSGYLGGWVVVTLLQHGYRVRTTVRSLAKEVSVREAVGRVVDPRDRLSFVACDLREDAGWDAAARGCDAVLHVASPMGQGDIKEKDLLGPARDGTLRVLKAARAAGVRRVVVTSSVVASTPSPVPGEAQPMADEAVWTDPDRKGVTAYGRAKTLAERAAWDFAEAGPALTTILPSMILGPVLSADQTGSIEVVSRMLTGKLPALPHLGFSIVDVRDLAELHVLALESPAAEGQRLVAAGDFLWLDDIANVLRAHLGERAAKVPRRRLPGLVLRALGLVSSDARFMATMLDKKSTYSSAKAERILGWRTRAAADSVRDCADSLAAGRALA